MKRAHLPSRICKYKQVLIKVGVDAPAREGAPMLNLVHDAEASKENTTEPAEVAGGSLLDQIADKRTDLLRVGRS